MSEEAKDFIKYVAEVIVILTIFLVIFSPEGIGSNLFNYLKYVEPILLQDWLSTSINVGSRSPGNFTTTTRLSGQPHTILIYTEDSKIYVNVEPPEETYLKTKFAIIEPTKIITNCEVIDQKIKLKENVVQTITVRKIIEEEACKIYISTSGKEEIKSGLNLQQKSSTQVSLPEEPATPSIDCNSQCRSQGFTSGECKDNCKLGETPLYKTDGDDFYIKAADAHITAFLPYSKNYQPNAWGFVEDLGINTLRLFTGGEGDIAHLNMKRYPNEWAENLNNFLSEADAHGVKVYFYELGTEWNTLLGIRPEDTTIEEAKSMIDKLTGDNNLGHDFINDDRILVWSVDNEPSISENPSREEDYKRLEWILEISDYIRSKGGKTVVASPRLDDNWGRGQDFHVTEPIFRGHVDYLERHSYKSVEFYQTCVDTGNSFSFEDCYNKIYASYKKLLQEEMIDDRGSFSIDQLIFGEFGVWIGESGTKANQGCINCFFEDEHRRAYYKAVLDAARDVGIKNICFHNLFSRTEGPTWTKNLIPDYGVVDVDGTYHDEELAIIIRDVYKSEESYCDSGFVCCCSGELPAESDCELECERLDFASGVCRKTTHALITKGANIPANQLVSVSSTYPKQYWAFPEQDYAWKTLQDLGVNAIQVWGGIEGNVLHIQANENHPWGKNYDSNWAENLESFLAKADSYGMKVVFHEMGNQYGTGLGIVPPMHNYRSVSPYSSLDNAIAVIDKIGGNNNLDKNFFEDDRVLWWTPINEARLDVDEVRNWLIPVLQRIKYYGGKTSVCVNDKKGRSYAEAFPYITPLIGDYIDYLQAHRYQEPVIRSITNQGPQADMYQPAYEAFSADFQSMIEGRGEFGIDKLALTEFGTGFDEWEYHYGTDITTIEQQADYIRAAFDAAQDKGITKLFWFNPIQIHSDYNSFGFIKYDGTIIPETYNAFKSTHLYTEIAKTTCELGETPIEVGCNDGYTCCCSGETAPIKAIQWFRTSSFTGTTGFQSIEELREAIPDCNYIYMDVFVDSIDEIATPRTTYENELDPAVQKAKQEGFKVVWRVQPKVGVKLGNRMNFDPTDPDPFFLNYVDAVVYWARKAEEYDVDDFVIGTELTKLEKYNDHWRSLIQNVKDIFTGKISYNTNFWYEDNDFNTKKSAGWMQDLDYIGVSAYWKMCRNEEAERGVTVEELVNNWYSYVGGGDLQGENIVKDHLKVFSETHEKPIVIVTGLQSAEDACLTPWAWDRTTVDLNEQDNWYEAVFRVFSDENWVYGFMFDGAWQTNANKRQNPDNAEFTIQGKLAEETVAKWFE